MCVLPVIRMNPIIRTARRAVARSRHRMKIGVAAPATQKPMDAAKKRRRRAIFARPIILIQAASAAPMRRAVRLDVPRAGKKLAVNANRKILELSRPINARGLRRAAALPLVIIKALIPAAARSHVLPDIPKIQR